MTSPTTRRSYIGLWATAALGCLSSTLLMGSKASPAKPVDAFDYDGTVVTHPQVFEFTTADEVCFTYTDGSSFRHSFLPGTIVTVTRR